MTSEVARETYGTLWHVLFAASAVALWHARNAQVFHNVCWTAGKVLTEIAQLLMLWRLRAPGGNAKEALTSWANVMLQQ